MDQSASEATLVPRTQLNDLPDECLLHIIHSLGTPCIGQALGSLCSKPALVCKRWCSLANGPFRSLHLHHLDDHIIQWLRTRSDSLTAITFSPSRITPRHLFVRLANLTPQLECLEIKAPIDYPVPAVPHALTIWTRLRSLHLGNPMRPEDTKVVLKDVAKLLPSLQHLGFRYLGNDLPLVWAKVDLMTGLTSLDVGCSVLPTSTAIRCYPILRKLDLESFQGVQLPTLLGLSTGLEVLIVRDASQLMALPEVLSHFSRLLRLKLQGCFLLGSLPDTLGRLSALHTLHFDHCPQLSSLPASLGALVMLTSLTVSGCEKLLEVPPSLGQVRGLRVLQVTGCKKVRRQPESFWGLEALETLVWTPARKRRAALSIWDPSFSEAGGWQSLSQLTRLRGLRVCKIDFFEMLPDSIGEIQSLCELELSHSNRVAEMPASLCRLMNLQALRLESCRHLKAMPTAMEMLTSLKKLELIDCGKLEALPGSLKSLEVCTLVKLPSLLYSDGLASWENMTSLTICQCEKLEELPQGLGQLSGLRDLHIQECSSLVFLPPSLGMLTMLKSLAVIECGVLRELPASLGQLSALGRLCIKSCGSLVSLPESLGLLTSLYFLCFSDCEGLTEVPEEVEELTAFKDWKRDNNLPVFWHYLERMKDRRLRNYSNPRPI